jgi:uracil-DNA glycosylase family 4
MRQLFPSNTFVQPKSGTGLRLVISDAPGETDSLKGTPLVGGSGKVFDAMLKKIGVDRTELTLCNVIQCRPKNGLFPTDRAGRSYISETDAYKSVQHCYDNHVEPLLKSRPWQRVDLLGEKPLKFIAKSNVPISKQRGSVVEIPALEYKMLGMPTLNPIDVMKQQVMFPVVVSDLAKSLKVLPEHYDLFPTLETVKQFQFTEFSFDLEKPKYRTLGKDAPIEMVGLCGEPTKVIIVPFQGAYKEELKRIFRNAKTVVGQNCISYDIEELSKEGVTISDDCEVMDIMLLHHLRFPHFSARSGEEEEKKYGDKNHVGGHDLEFIASQFVNKPVWKDETHTTGWELRCARDTDSTLIAYKELRRMCEQSGLMDIYRYVQVPMAKICLLMHKTGFTRDPQRLKEVRERLLKEIAEDETKLPPELRGYDETKHKNVTAPEGYVSPKTGKPVKKMKVPYTVRVQPWRSERTKKDYLYNKLKIEPQTHPKTGKITCDKNALDRIERRLLSRTYKVIVEDQDITLETAKTVALLKSLNLKATMISGFCKENEEGVAEKVHPSFNVHGTSAGRLSSSNPNFQNQPEEARYMYVPSQPGWKIISIDFSGIENRLVAYLANDHERLARFNADPKFSEHKYACSLFMDIPYDQVKKDKAKDSPYSLAKVTVHGADRLLGPLKIAKTNDLDFKEVRDRMYQWKKKIARTVEWQQEVIKQVQKQGWLKNPFGRAGYFYTDTFATKAISFLPQSTAFDVLARASIGFMYQKINWPVEFALKIAKVLEPLPGPANLLALVHDEYVIEAHPDYVDETIRVVRKCAEQPWPELGGLILPANVAVGDDWGSVVEL